MKPSQLLDSLSSQDCLAVIVTAGLITHIVFRRTEPSDPSYLALLVLGIPFQLTSLLAKRYESVLLGFFATFSTFWGSLLLSLTIYRLAPWHPLYIYPGPIIARLSKFWGANKARTGKQHILHQELHKKYGNVVRVGPNEISICDVAAVEDMLGPNGPPKGSWWEGRFSPTDPVKPLIALRDKMEHTRRRRPWTRGFSTGALKGYEPMIEERSQQLVDHLTARAEKKDHVDTKDGKEGRKARAGLDLMLWFSYFSFDLMVDLAFGGGAELMRDGDNEGIWNLVEEAQETALFFAHVPWLGQLFFRLPFAASRLKTYRSFVKEETIKRKEKGSKWKDLFYYLSGEDGVDDDGKKPSMAEVVSNGALISLAGSDTTSTVLSCLFFLLCKHPEKYRRLQAEIDTLEEEKLKDCTAHSSLPYLTAVLNEAMRMYPPVLSGTTRTAVQPMTIGPYFVPEGTSLFIPFYALHRDPRYFSLPDQFIPERWLPGEELTAAKPFIHNAKAFVPFSLGPSNCVGKNFALIEMRMVACLLVKKFEMRFKEGYDTDEWEREMQDFFITKKGELPVVISLREGGNREDACGYQTDG